MALTDELVVQALQSVIDPQSGKSLIRADMVRGLSTKADSVVFTLLVTGRDASYEEALKTAAQKELTNQLGDTVDIQIAVDHAMISLGDDLQVDGKKTAFQGNTIAVASGKGGVGKSTISVNLAVTMARQGYKIGLVDTDIYGPSIPTMFGVEDEKPRVNPQRKIIPLEKYGVKLLSMGFLTDPGQAVIWRGPMVSGAVRQFLGDAEWGDLDFLILDLPPGTGDIQLTIVQTLSLTGAIVVTTPQEVALADARRGVGMFRNVNVPVLGIVENMAYFTPPDLLDRKYYLFGQGGGRRLSAELETPFLGEIPIEEPLRESGDAGKPMMVENGATPAGEAFESVAEAVALQVAVLNARKPAQGGLQIEIR